MERSGGEFTKMKQTLHLGLKKYSLCAQIWGGIKEKKKSEPISISIGTSTACVTSTMTFGSSFQVRQRVYVMFIKEN